MRRHLHGIEQLSGEELRQYLATADEFVEISRRDLKKVPALRGKTIINLFLEPSTRTRTSFEIAGKRLSADTINVSGSASAIVKGETLLDTARTLESMAPDVIVVRHSESGASEMMARELKSTSIVNAGDGLHEHPTQALLDCLSLMQHCRLKEQELKNLKVAIVGDVLHSRVARSTIWAHRLLGNHVRLVGPATLIPRDFASPRCFGHGIEIEHDLRQGLEGVDIIICLRMQFERAAASFIPSVEEYSRHYCITEKLLREVAPNSIVLHPGPANRGIEISSEVIDGPRSLVRNQVENGVAVRMAVLFMLATNSLRNEPKS